MSNESHRKPVNFSDYIALGFCRIFRWGADIVFRRRHDRRALVIETIAAIPGIVGGLFIHLKSIRKQWGDFGRIHALHSEAENERMHYQVFCEILPLGWKEKVMIYSGQFGFFVFFFLLYLFSPYTAHRMVGYFEEEAIYSYNKYLKAIEEGEVENIPAPMLAIEYWNLLPNARLKEVIEVVIQDEIRHRDTNHRFADNPFSGKK
ncbi:MULTISPECIES: alternative oxidase [Holospora]|uniref:Ubiquinol oxidase 2, mitochondrial n=2 Tax=Holospora TaxID=44747 RepID=A0A061JHS0_9PROT|nr:MULTISPECIES: alternative oxidase [Holospora]ETZ05017.1 ubiquinol oxidase 2, mitochondrial [Holospora undulata HU1]GAJ45818.1 ubiquinol oxidase 2, mitochondrial [Holospora elegans E1]